MSVSRRLILKSLVTATGGMMLGFRLPVFANATPFSAHEIEGDEINAWIAIEPDDTITIRVGQSEMGQGVMTALPMIIADELEVDWSKIRVEYADVQRGVYGPMQTGGSRAVRRSRPFLQQAGAEARMKLIKAAAETWLVSAEECYADYGKIYHKPTRRSLGYGELAAKAAVLSVANVTIKKPRDFTMMGLPTPRVDTPAKVDGSATFGMDVRVENMVYAAVKHCPVIGGKLRGYRFNAVRNMPGVISAVRLENGVAIVAETFWQANKAAEALPVQWDLGDKNKVYTEKLRKEYFEALATPGVVIQADKGTEAALETSETIIESDYLVPYLAHACMEPLNCTVHVTNDNVEVWGGFQNPQSVIDATANQLGRSKDSIKLNNCFLGGGFGRRSNNDYVLEAVTIADEVRLPVQMIWNREDDMRSGQYRPMAALRFKAGLDLDKNIVAYTNHSVTHSIKQDRDGDVPGGVDSSSVSGLKDLPYEFSPREISHTIKNTHIPTWWWRSVGHSQNAFALECFIDELAVAAKSDPFNFRRKYLRDRPDLTNVLNELERLSNWKRRASGRERGMAIHESFGTIVGQVVEVSVTPSGGAKVHKVVSVVDCGNLVNPRIAQSQIESGVLYGLSAALYGKITIEQGRVLENNFDTYRVMEMSDTPEMETHFLPASSDDRWGGLGEPSVPPVAPAVVNALYKITRRRIRSLPVSDYYLQRS